MRIDAGGLSYVAQNSDLSDSLVIDTTQLHL